MTRPTNLDAMVQRRMVHARVASTPQVGIQPIQTLHKRAEHVFQGSNGLVLTGVLSALGTLFALFVLLLLGIYLRKRYKRRHSTAAAGRLASSRGKVRLSSEVGHQTQTTEHEQPRLRTTAGPFGQTQQVFHIQDPQLRQLADAPEPHFAGFPVTLSQEAHFPSLPQQQGFNTFTRPPMVQHYTSAVPVTKTPFPIVRPRSSTDVRGHWQGTHSETRRTGSSQEPVPFLPPARVTTPLSVPFGNHSASPSSGNARLRPSVSATASSELMPRSKEGSEQDHNAVINTFHRHQGSPSRQPKAKTSPVEAQGPFAEQQEPLSAPASVTSSRSTVFLYHKPITAVQGPRNRSHAQSLSSKAEYNYAGDHSRVNSGASGPDTIRHLRNRSNGTVLTYASSMSDVSAATTRIQPVVFNDSPRSSMSVNLYQPSKPYLEPSTTMPTTSSNAPASGSHPSTAASSETLRQYESPPQSAASMTYNFKFPTPRKQQPSETHEAGTPSSTAKKTTRRASGKLPDMLFSRTPIHDAHHQSSEENANLQSPISPTSPDDFATLDDESVLDPMEGVSRRRTQEQFEDLRLRSLSLAVPGGGSIRPPLASSNPSTSSLMTSTSSSYYGTAM